MGMFVVAVACAAGLATASPAEPLQSRAVPISLFVIPESQPENFDLRDVRDELKAPASYSEVQPHSIFGIKRHLGLAAGYDQGIVHGSLGFYITVAEWGRWNFGITSPEFGFGRYRVYDERTKQMFMKTQSTILISLASVHFRGGYLRSINKDWYFNLEQVFDARDNLNGSQFGISFSNP